MEYFLFCLKKAKTKRAFKQTLNLCVWMNVLPSIVK